MGTDYSAGPDRAGVRWLLLVATIELRSSPDFSELQLFRSVAQKIAVVYFSPHVSHVLSAANLIPLEKRESRVRPISFGIVLRRLVTRSLMPSAIAESKAYLYPLQVGCGVKCSADAAVHEARSFIEKFGHDLTYIRISADTESAFNKNSRAERLGQTVEHATSIIRLVKALYAKGNLAGLKPYLRLGGEVIRSCEGNQQGERASGLLFALDSPHCSPYRQRVRPQRSALVRRLWADRRKYRGRAARHGHHLGGRRKDQFHPILNQN